MKNFLTAFFFCLLKATLIPAAMAGPLTLRALEDGNLLGFERGYFKIVSGHSHSSLYFQYRSGRWPEQITKVEETDLQGNKFRETPKRGLHKVYQPHDCSRVLGHCRYNVTLSSGITFERERETSKLDDGYISRVFTVSSEGVRRPFSVERFKTDRLGRIVWREFTEIWSSERKAQFQRVVEEGKLRIRDASMLGPLTMKTESVPVDYTFLYLLSVTKKVAEANIKTTRNLLRFKYRRLSDGRIEETITGGENGTSKGIRDAQGRFLSRGINNQISRHIPFDCSRVLGTCSSEIVREIDGDEPSLAMTITQLNDTVTEVVGSWYVGRSVVRGKSTKLLNKSKVTAQTDPLGMITEWIREEKNRRSRLVLFGQVKPVFVEPMKPFD